MKPVVHDLFCGLGGWAEGFLTEGYECIGYDIERHDYGSGGYPGTLILRDVRGIHGSELKDATCIVASPPCQEPSYRAMPWKRAKALNAIGPPHLFIELFNACFRIQREASEAAGHHIPLIVENVCGAQKWVGKAPAHFGSYYLWGDVGQIGKRIVAGPIKFGVFIAPEGKARKLPGFRFDGSGRSFQSESVKVAGQNWSKFKETGEVSPHWRLQGKKTKDASEPRWSERTAKRLEEIGLKVGAGHRPCGHWTNPAENGVKCGGDWFGPECDMSLSRMYASAMIAKIPFPLAQHIARCFKPAGPRLLARNVT